MPTRRLRFCDMQRLAEDDPDVPVLAPDTISACRCGAGYDEARFLALVPPPKGDTWKFELVTLAVRQCGWEHDRAPPR